MSNSSEKQIDSEKIKKSFFKLNWKILAMTVSLSLIAAAIYIDQRNTKLQITETSTPVVMASSADIETKAKGESASKARGPQLSYAEIESFARKISERRTFETMQAKLKALQVLLSNRTFEDMYNLKIRTEGMLKKTRRGWLQERTKFLV